MWMRCVSLSSKKYALNNKYVLIKELFIAVPISHKLNHSQLSVLRAPPHCGHFKIVLQSL